MAAPAPTATWPANVQLTPNAAAARLPAMNTTGIDDPLFRAIDLGAFRTLGSAARNFTNLITNAVVRMTIALPANIKLLDCGAAGLCPASARAAAERSRRCCGHSALLPTWRGTTTS